MRGSCLLVCHNATGGGDNRNAEATQALRNAVDQYNLTMQTALSEVNDAISAYFANLEYIKNISKACEASHDYNERAVSNYKSGLSPFINVADAQMAYLQNMNSLIQARANALNALVTLYRALGGGWDGDVETMKMIDLTSNRGISLGFTYSFGKTVAPRRNVGNFEESGRL